MPSIIHFTTVHSRRDTRIRVKELGTLAQAFGGGIALYVQDGEGDETDATTGVRVVDTGRRPRGRLARMSRGTWRMYRAVARSRPKLAHFHDPELIPAGLLLKLSGISVVYDVHEDVPRQMMSKRYLNPRLRWLLARLFGGLEWLSVRAYDGIVCVTPLIAGRFEKRAPILVQNFPIPSELAAKDPVDYVARPPDFAYVGGILPARGAREMVEAVASLPDGEARLRMAGAISPTSFARELEALPGWAKVDFIGWADRAGVARVLGEVRAGLVVLHPLENYKMAQPVKLFEYMAAGLPVIASDFPLWRRIVEEAGSGLLVDPLDVPAIAEAMQWILDHPAEAEAMGKRGRAAVRERFNWTHEGARLVELYKRLLGPARPRTG